VVRTWSMRKFIARTVSQIGVRVSGRWQNRRSTWSAVGVAAASEVSAHSIRGRWFHTHVKAAAGAPSCMRAREACSPSTRCLRERPIEFT
jgi:hypothetical protein